MTAEQTLERNDMLVDTDVRAAAIGLLNGLEVLKRCKPYDCCLYDLSGWHKVGGVAFVAAACPACKLRDALKSEKETR